jgi:hypothetical protein
MIGTGMWTGWLSDKEVDLYNSIPLSSVGISVGKVVVVRIRVEGDLFVNRSTTYRSSLSNG